MGKETPDASSRWSCDSVVRAPIAPHEIQSYIHEGNTITILSAYCRRIFRKRQAKRHITYSNVLWGDGIEQLATDWNTHVRQITKELSSDSNTLVDFERVVDIRVVDESFPYKNGSADEHTYRLFGIEEIWMI